MSETRQLTFPEEGKPERLDTFLTAALPELSRSQLKKLIADDRVTLAGQPVKASYKLKGGESIQLALPDPVPTATLPEAIPLDIRYEDQDLIVVNKPAGMVVHPAAGHRQGTLVNALLHHCHDLAGIGGELRPGIVHRIDKDTSGILVACKNDAVHRQLADQFKQHSIQRHYLALVHGCPKGEAGRIEQPIGRHPLQRKKMSSRAKNAKHAVTRWQLLENYPRHRLSLLKLCLETGRTHQIRVHFAERNLPLVRDPLYGSRSKEATLKDPQLRRLLQQLPGQALHAASLGFVHPRSGKYLEFSCEMPDTLASIVAYLNQ
jgi:23S rRNA pseudouridine1911/1915/1917 synthase